MTKQDIFETLQNLECELFYRYADTPSDDPDFESIKKAHEATKKALIAFYDVVKEKQQ